MPQCGETGVRRLTSAEQQAVGLAYVAALVDLAVGDGLASLPFLDGRSVRPSSIGRAQAFVHAIGGDKQLLYAAGAGARVTARDLVGDRMSRLLLGGSFRSAGRMHAGSVLRGASALAADVVHGDSRGPSSARGRVATCRGRRADSSPSRPQQRDRARPACGRRAWRTARRAHGPRARRARPLG